MHDTDNHVLKPGIYASLSFVNACHLIDIISRTEHHFDSEVTAMEIDHHYDFM
jgi:hypothetical protein